MAEMVDLQLAVAELSHLVGRIPDDRLGAATPCDKSSVGDLLEHLDGLARAFAAAAAKDLGPLTNTPPQPDVARLDPAWRTAIPTHLDALARAWTDPGAWDGLTQVGGVSLPGEIAGHIALNEVVLHGWDLAVASGQPYQPGTDAMENCLASLTTLYPPEHLERRKGIFEAPVPVPPDAPLVDRLVAYSGRDPAWSSR